MPIVLSSKIGLKTVFGKSQCSKEKFLLAVFLLAEALAVRRADMVSPHPPLSWRKKALLCKTQ
jgi:hypothetical protein